MNQYLLIESRDVFESQAAERTFALATNLVTSGADVALFLVQNGVLSARRGVEHPLLSQAAKAGVQILADDFSLKERAIADGQLDSGVTASPLSLIVDRMIAGDRVIWN